MTDLRKAAEMALEALNDEPKMLGDWLDNLKTARETLRQALAQPPCQTGSQCIGGKCPECEREWVGLTDEEKKRFVVAYFVDKYDRETAVTLMDDYEAVLKEKNG